MNTEEIYEAAFVDELEKIAGEVSIPDGGYNNRFFFNDLTQVMNKKDADMVKRNINPLSRYSAGTGVFAALGASLGESLSSAASPKLSKIKNAITGALLLGGLHGLESRTNYYDKAVLKAGKRLIEKSREKEKLKNAYKE